MNSSGSPAARSGQDLPAVLSGKWMALLASSVATATVVAVVALWWAGTSGLTGHELITARFDAVKIGLSMGLGGGGVLALYLAWRRQRSIEIGLRQKDLEHRHQERVAEITENDARQRRITELYTKAADQLGSADAAVRLAGLYALQRLGQVEAEQREIVLNVLCAYLRMPYPPAPTALPDDAAPDERERFDNTATVRAQERQVRITAHRILARHRRPSDIENFWRTQSIDLAGAYLYGANLSDVDLSGAHLANVNLQGGNLRNITLSGAYLARANLSMTDLRDARLDGADLFGADLGGAVTLGANFTAARGLPLDAVDTAR
ncbi:pentapeptide repeat-containing protein [Saccharothrix stipae]